jgi:ABC-type glycerol-3-phosphate transport system permease component
MEFGFLLSLQEWRDIFLIIFTALGAVLFLFAILFTLIIGWLSMSTINRARGILKNNVQPAVENVRETTHTIKSTVQIISDNAVKPVVKAYGAYAGARRFVAVFMRFAKAGRAGKAG